ncbi:hypothetical protein HFO06_26560 [Rhizobium leguminosarum]|uniref:hypothetical protein n=1 Tax=Rhizobium leguminosarum TaxID=384 RepID=UPI001C981E65|nr:hypothetical protein [Rhizobium leguminosarum]MBY5766622.1 hypothetical protein [Rhizobium leguminosarum]
MLKWLAVCLVAAVFAIGWAIEWNFAHLTRSMFGLSGRASTSMEHYEIAFRNGYPSHKGAHTWYAEWILSVPRAYVSTEVGENGNVNAPKSAQSGQAPAWLGGPRFGDYFAGLHTVLDPASSELKPAIFASRQELDDEYVNIHLANIGSLPVDANNYCVRQHDMEAFLMQRGWKNGWSTCNDRQRRCLVYMDVDHWFVRLIVSRKVYEQPDRICSITRNFLNKFTVRRDPY